MGPIALSRTLLAATGIILSLSWAVAQEMQQVPRFVEERYLEAAGQGDVASQFALGLLHERGLARGASMENAASWYRLASTNGHAPAQYRLALLLERKRVRAIEGETIKALYRSAAIKGLKEAQHNLAILLEQQGEYREAFEWYRAAAEAGIAASMRALAVIHAQGRGVEIDLVKAWVWASKAVAAGDPSASRLLSELDDKLTDNQREGARLDLKNSR